MLTLKKPILLGIFFMTMMMCVFSLQAEEPQESTQPQESTHSEAPEQKRIVEVEISGLKNVSFKKVWGEIEVRKGQKYSQEKVDEDLRKLFDMGLFSSINIDVTDKEQGVKVTFIVTEKPVITKIEFKGNKVYKASGLKDEITIKEQEAFDEAKIAESKDKILTKYKEKGYAHVEVSAEALDTGEGKKQLVFTITEGNRIRIQEVVISGASAFTEKKVKSVMKLKEKKIYKEEVLEKGVQALKKFYKSRGYYNFEMADPEVSFNEDRSKVIIKVTITEGIQYKIGTLGFQNNTIYTVKELRKDFPIKEGQVYHQENFEQSAANLQALYAEKGHVFARIEPKVITHDESRIMDIEFIIQEGPLVRVGEVEIGGHEVTKDYVIEREILLKQGEPLTMSRVRRSQERIFNLGMFEDVNLETRPNAEKPNEQLDLIFSVKEKSQINMLSVGLGYSSVDRLVGNASVQFLNPFGRGERINTTVETGARRTNFDVSYYNPWILQSYYSFGANVFHTRREREFRWERTNVDVLDLDTKSILEEVPLSTSIQESDFYEEFQDGGGITFGKRFWENYHASLGYSYEGTKISSLEERYKTYTSTATRNISEEIIRQEDRGTVATSSVATTLSRDTRDNVFDTTRGSRQALTYTVAGGALQGDNDFQKVVLDTAWFFPSFWKFVFGVRTMVGVVDSYSGTAIVPLYERFYLGGAETVRGYEYRGEIGVPEGGKFVGLVNVEYGFPLIREKRQTILKGAFFFDAGNTWSSTKIGYKKIDLKRGVGFGLRFAIPQFPIRLDWGYGLDHKEGEPKSQFYFTLGSLF